MFKKIITVFSCISIMFSSAITVCAADNTTMITDRKIFLYPVFTSLSVKKDIPQGAEDAAENEQFILADNENSLSVSFKFKSEADKKDIMFVSVYDMNEDKYVTSDKGAAVTDTCIFTGLMPGHKYMLRASTLFNEKTVDVAISKTKAETTVNNTSDFNVKNGVISNFDDIVSELKELQIINGYEDGSVRPDNKITRAEVCAIVNRVIRQGKSSMTDTSFGIPFTDITQEAWFYNDVMRSNEFGLVNGYDDNTFKPQNDITYNEYIKIITSMLQYVPYAETNGGYPNGYITAANNAGIIKGIEFNGNDKITRKDAMIILYNAINSPIVLVKSYNTGTSHEYALSDIAYMDFIK